MTIGPVRLGFLGEASIRTMIRRTGASLMSLDGVLIRCIDSTRLDSRALVVSMFHKVSELGICTDFGFLTNGAALPQLVQDNFFTGFDEIWAWSASQAVRSPPRIVMTSERPLVEREVDAFGAGTPGELAAWMEDARCSIVLGDGCGLNYAILDPGLFQVIDDLRSTLQ